MPGGEEGWGGGWTQVWETRVKESHPDIIRDRKNMHKLHTITRHTYMQRNAAQFMRSFVHLGVHLEAIWSHYTSIKQSIKQSINQSSIQSINQYPRLLCFRCCTLFYILGAAVWRLPVGCVCPIYISHTTPNRKERKQESKTAEKRKERHTTATSVLYNKERHWHNTYKSAVPLYIWSCKDTSIPLWEKGACSLSLRQSFCTF